MSYQKIDLGNNNKRTRNKKKLCPDCRDTNDYVNLFSNKISKIEEIVDEFRTNLSSRKTNKFSTFNAKFTLNNVPCELEYNLSQFTLEDLQKLVIFTTPNRNNNNEYSSSNKSNESVSSEDSNSESSQED
ncbi:hypothetical protein RclHR1_03310001 [Rhizophagus clarus]|uniref:Uncharacterized protein n=1 Tax=Rhizophagus clarus TaxID=94130 RepID=A0A2Z6R9L4_9GLOM|nr:hypothetical protein RclHR1_03310001 [Rhizophagus clarus]GES95521.1 hypothetical protein GLOIN_2v1769442 [Rhizophagus clarus]